MARRDFNLFLGKTIEYLIFKDINNDKTKFICDCLYCGSVDNFIDVKQTFRKSRKKCFHCSKCRPYRKLENNNGWKGIGTMSASYFSHIKNDAKYRNISFEITKEDLWNQYLKQDRKCAITNEYIEFHNLSKSKIHNNNGKGSTDRIDSNQGYTKDNIWIVHRDFNFYKFTYSLEQVIYFSNLITNPIISGNDIDFFEIRDWWWNRFSKSAKYEIKITKQDLVNQYLKQNGKCFYTGLPITIAKVAKDSGKHKFSVDRVDSTKNYTIDNIVICYKEINMMKGILSVDRFRFLAQKVTEKFLKLV